MPSIAASSTLLAQKMKDIGRVGERFPEGHEMMRGMGAHLVEIGQALEPLLPLLARVPSDSDNTPSTRASGERVQAGSHPMVTKAASSAAKMKAVDELQAAFAAVVCRFVELGTGYAMTRDSFVYRMASTRRVSQDILELHVRVEKELGVPLRSRGALKSVVEDGHFEKLVEKQRAAEEDEMSRLSKRNPRSFVYSRRGHEPMEVLTVLKFEMDYHKNDHSKQHQASMKAVFFSVVRSSNGRVSKIPLWYIPPYYLQFDKEQLKQGSLGYVARGELHGSNERQNGPGHQVVAVKTLEIHVDGIDLFRRQVELWFGLSHENVLKLAGASHCSHPAMVVTEWADHGTLHSYLWSSGMSDDKRRLETWRKFREAVQGLQYLCSQKIVHGNLKATNILVDAQGVVKIADFGTSMLHLQNVTMQDDLRSPEKKQRFDESWRAPECRGKLGRPSFASDVYSLGLCMLEAVLKTGFVEMPKDPRTAEILHPKTLDDDEWSLIKSMCKVDSSLRPALPQVLESLNGLVTKRSVVAGA